MIATSQRIVIGFDCNQNITHERADNDTFLKKESHEILARFDEKIFDLFEWYWDDERKEQNFIVLMKDFTVWLMKISITSMKTNQRRISTEKIPIVIDSNIGKVSCALVHKDNLYGKYRW